MSWGMAFKELVNGFKTGYEFADQMADAKSEREYREKQAAALDIDTQLKELQVGDYEENRAWDREAQEANIASTRASTRYNEAQASQAEYEASPGQRARAIEREDVNTGYIRSQTESMGATTQGQRIENDAALQKLRTRYDAVNAMRRRLGMEPITPKVAPQSALPVEGGTSTSSVNIPADERDLAIRMIAMEANGEPEEGKQAVANVILNRARSGRYGRSLKDVITAEAQFEPWATRRDELFALDPNSPAYKNAEYAFEQALQSDVTGGATHFLNPEIVRKRRRDGDLPAWARGEGQRVGQHVFYAPEGRVADGAVGANRYAPALAYNDAGTMNDADNTPFREAVSQVSDEPWEAAVIGGYEALDNAIPDRAVSTDVDDDEDEVVLAQNAADPEDINDMLNTMDEQGLTDGMSEAQSNLMLLALARQEAMADGDVEKANAVSASILLTYKEAYGQYLAIAQDAAEGGDLDDATEALVRAYSFVPDGMEVDIEKSDKGFTIIQKDVNGEEVRREEAMPPEDMFKLIMAQDPTMFEKILAASSNRKGEATVSAAAQAQIQNARAGRAVDVTGLRDEEARMVQSALPDPSKARTPAEMGDLMEQVTAEVTTTVAQAYGAEDAIPPEEMMALQEVASMAIDRAARQGQTLYPQSAARTVVGLTLVNDDLSPKNPVVAENEDGSAVYRTAKGEVTLSPEEHASIQGILNGKIARLKAEQGQKGWLRSGIEGAIEGATRMFDAPAGQGPRSALPVPATAPNPFQFNVRQRYQ